ncbi:hypothetical protein BCR44DRAFT_1059113 [Catenaria anguillulae PL171]|uniref:Uncharacterized protein n=1 Tax=Catenaria anguillulae PL171 TaxID=765915 RepID=A0A1Y2HQ73_9FUNG|nr:hypothetical protein BCR44DRAFT_1059113 [Catenaria anguillulae PL171]
MSVVHEPARFRSVSPRPSAIGDHVPGRKSQRPATQRPSSHTLTHKPHPPSLLSVSRPKMSIVAPPPRAHVRRSDDITSPTSSFHRPIPGPVPPNSPVIYPSPDSPPMVIRTLVQEPRQRPFQQHFITSCDQRHQPSTFARPRLCPRRQSRDRHDIVLFSNSRSSSQWLQLRATGPCIPCWILVQEARLGATSPFFPTVTAIVSLVVTAWLANRTSTTTPFLMLHNNCHASGTGSGPVEPSSHRHNDNFLCVWQFPLQHTIPSVVSSILCSPSAYSQPPSAPVRVHDSRLLGNPERRFYRASRSAPIPSLLSARNIPWGQPTFSNANPAATRLCITSQSLNTPGVP